MRFHGNLLIATCALCVVLAPAAAVAQELSLDPAALDASGAGAKQKGKKAAAKAHAGASGAAADKPGKVENRQFGELEGWSPGKAPPKPKDKEDSVNGPFGGKAPVSVTPSGNMAVGLPF
jgi:hypothetical protein